MNGETLLVILGYSFSDEHINEILFQGLRSNPRLSVLTFCYGDLPVEFIELGRKHRNMTFLAADKACIGGIVGDWVPRRTPQDGEVWPFWDSTNNKFVLGNFTRFAEYLEAFIGFKNLYRSDEGETHPVSEGEQSEA